jgi:hypothetical protein
MVFDADCSGHKFKAALNNTRARLGGFHLGFYQAKRKPPMEAFFAGAVR